MPSPQRGARFQEEFARRRMRQILLLVPIVIAVLAIRAASKGADFFGLPTEMVAVVSFILIGGVAIFSLFNWRCPSCSASLGKTWNPHFCPKCGLELQ